MYTCSACRAHLATRDHVVSEVRFELLETQGTWRCRLLSLSLLVKWHRLSFVCFRPRTTVLLFVLRVLMLAHKSASGTIRTRPACGYIVISSRETVGASTLLQTLFPS